MISREEYRENTNDCLRIAYHDAGANHQQLAAATGVPEGTLRVWLRRHAISRGKGGRWKGDDRIAATPSTPGIEVPKSFTKPERAGATVTDDTVTLVAQPNPMGTDTLTAEDLFKRHGFDPADWTFDATLNRYDALTGNGGITTLCQLKVIAKRRVRVDLITPARAPGWKPPVRPPIGSRVSVTQPKAIIVCSDAHHPYIETPLHRAMCRLLAFLQPVEGIDLGDGLDLPKPSRHRDNPAFNATPQHCLDSEYEAWLDRLFASPRTKWKRAPGNHDERIKNEQLERVASLYGLRRAQTQQQIAGSGEEHPVLDIGYLLRLDELGVEMIRPTDDGAYHHAEVKVAPGLLAGHGTKSGRHGGAVKVGDALTCSWMQGHDHKQALAYITRRDDDGRAGDTALCSVGTLARRDLGYMPNPEVQQGLATVMVWPDGRFHIELARWDAGELVWRDQRFGGE